MQLQAFADDPLERFSQEAIDSTLRRSCDDLRYYDYMCWYELIESIRNGAPLLGISEELKSALVNATDERLKLLCSGSIATFAIRHKSRITDVNIPQSMMRMYVQQHKFSAIRYGNEYATQVYGITYSESNTLVSISGFMDGLITESYEAVLRCSENTILTLLTEKDATQERIQHLRLKKVYECLCEDETTEPNCVKQNTISAYDPETDEGRSNIDTSKKLLARKMLIQGFTAHAVSVELGLTPRQCRHVAEQARAAKYLDAIPSSSPTAYDNIRPSVLTGKNAKASKTCKFLLRCQETIINSSILMRIYISLGGETVRESTQVATISLAYGIYCSIRHDVYGLAERGSDKRLTLQDAWILAVDYRSHRSFIERCKGCGTDTFISTIQKKNSCECQFCQ